MRPMPESPLYGEIMREFSTGNTRIFRQNAGVGWQGTIVEQSSQRLVLLNPRPIKAGAAGMADLGGLTSVIITPNMLGQRIAIDVQIECKAAKKYPTPDQRNYLAIMQALGARAGVARSLEDARRIILGLTPE